MFWDLMRKLWMRRGASAALGEFAEDFAGGVEELQFWSAVWRYAQNEAVVAFGVFQLEYRAAVAGAAEDDSRVIAWVSFQKLFEFGFALIFGEF